MGEPIDLDKALRRRHQRTVEGASDSITTDPDNIMDNWLVSTNEMRRQKDSLSKDRHERAQWESRENLNPGRYSLTGTWRYSKNKNQKSWKPSGRRVRGNIGAAKRFPAYRGDITFSEIYRLWLEDRKQEFLNTLYR